MKGFNGGLQFSSSASHGNFFTRNGGVCDAPRKRGGDGKRPAALQGRWSFLGVVVGVRGELCNFEEWIGKDVLWMTSPGRRALDAFQGHR